MRYPHPLSISSANTGLRLPPATPHHASPYLSSKTSSPRCHLPPAASHRHPHSQAKPSATNNPLPCRGLTPSQTCATRTSLLLRSTVPGKRDKHQPPTRATLPPASSPPPTPATNSKSAPARAIAQQAGHHPTRAPPLCASHPPALMPLLLPHPLHPALPAPPQTTKPPTAATPTNSPRHHLRLQAKAKSKTSNTPTSKTTL